MNNEERIRIASQLYDARRTAKNCWPATWKNKIKPFKDIIKQTMEADAIDVMPAAIRLAAKAAETVPHEGILFLAAAVDMVEPE